MTIEGFLGSQHESKAIYDVIASEVAALGDSEVRVSKSQIAFRGRENFAIVWMRRQYLRGKGAPLVLSLSFPAIDPSPRWKEIVEVNAESLHPPY